LDKAIGYLPPEGERNDDEKKLVADIVALETKKIAELNPLEMAIIGTRYIELIILRFEFISNEVYQFCNKKLKGMWEWLRIYFPDTKELNERGEKIETKLEVCREKTRKSEYRSLQS
jgi:hypothetical protein